MFTYTNLILQALLDCSSNISIQLWHVTWCAVTPLSFQTGICAEQKLKEVKRDLNIKTFLLEPIALSASAPAHF